jgi:hypothetical protein
LIDYFVRTLVVNFQPQARKMSKALQVFGFCGAFHQGEPSAAAGQDFLSRFKMRNLIAVPGVS